MLHEALRVLEERRDIDLVVITLSFDESRMFDLLRLAVGFGRGPDLEQRVGKAKLGADV
jgi:hypothetical protein